MGEEALLMEKAVAEVAKVVVFDFCSSGTSAGSFFSISCWEKNRNCFDFLIHGEEIRFSNFRLRHLGKFGISRGRMSPRMKPT